MPAINCHRCKELISDQESHCPFCGAPQQTERAARVMTRGLFGDPNNILSWIVGTNIFMYVCSVGLNFEAAFSMENGLFGLGSPDFKALHLLGLTGGVSWHCGHWWTLLTASFLHGSLLHIFFNLSWLRQLGTITIVVLGPSRFAFTYLVTGVGGFLLSNFWSGVPTIGASCSLFGLMGLLICFGQRRGGTWGRQLNRQVWAWAIVGFVFGLIIPMVNNAGHIGGFISGYLLGFVFPKQEGIHESGGLRLVTAGLLGLTLVGFALSYWKISAVLDNFQAFLRYGVCQF